MSNVFVVGKGELIITRGFYKGQEAVFVNKTKNLGEHGEVVPHPPISDMGESDAIFVFGDDKEFADKFANGLFKTGTVYE